MTSANDTPGLARMDCIKAREGLSCILDGESDSGQTQFVEQHLAGCAECADYDEELRYLHAQLRIHTQGSCDLERLWSGVENKIESNNAFELIQASAANQSTKEGPVDHSKRLMFAAAASVAVCAIIGGVGYYTGRRHGLPFVVETTQDFQAFHASGNSLDLATKEVDQLRQWIADRVDFRLPANLRPPEGFSVAGARLCSFLSRRLAFLYYQRGKASLSVYLTKADGLELPDEDQRHIAKIDDGFSTVTWRQENMALMMVSNIPEPELTSIANQFNDRLPSSRGTPA